MDQILGGQNNSEGLKQHLVLFLPYRVLLILEEAIKKLPNTILFTFVCILNVLHISGKIKKQTNKKTPFHTCALTYLFSYVSYCSWILDHYLLFSLSTMSNAPMLITPSKKIFSVFKLQIYFLHEVTQHLNENRLSVFTCRFL